MKCIILAGGSGDALWPLSRRKFPKQFMNVKEGRSILQETVVRNMPFCDEFLIITNENYKHIVNGQLKAFQSLKYRVLLEGVAHGTAAAIMLGTLFCNQTETVLVVNSDNLIDGDNYKDTIIKAKELSKTSNIVTVGSKPLYRTSTLGYIKRKGDVVTQYISKVNFDNMQSKDFTYEEGYLWNTGILVFSAGAMVNLVSKVCPELYKKCKQAKRKVPAIRRTIKFNESVMKDIPTGSIETLVFEQADNIKVVEAAFRWKDVGSANDLENIAQTHNQEFVIKKDCNNVTVINEAERKLVVANDLKDVVVVNTDDALLISSKRSADSIKDIIKDNNDTYEMYFDHNRISYKEWGTHELISYNDGYKVRKVTIYPGYQMNLHKHELRTEHWSVVEGVATITVGEDTRDYNRFESVDVPIGVMHKAANRTDKNVVIIEIGIGENLIDDDFVKIYQSCEENNNVVAAVEPIVKLDPAFKDNLWGGTKLRDVYGKKCDYDIIAESWELSAHPDGLSRIATGKYKGRLFNDYLSIIGKEALGWKCQAQDRFPILIKFIDAKKDLSIQIHPDDEYALEKENEYGKNEMWYVIDAEPGAFLYCGLKRDATKEEIKERIKNNTITEILNRIDVKPGDVVMVKAGTIHAIGAGILIAEIQQNSNCTYRMYDYDRRDKFGNLRELHIDKSLDVVVPEKYVKDNKNEIVITRNEHYVEERLVQCKYFEVTKYEVNDEVRIPVDEASFMSALFIEGNGSIAVSDENGETTMDYKPADSFFVSAGKKEIIIRGKGTCLITHV